MNNEENPDNCTNCMIGVIMGTVMVTLFIVLIVGAAMVHIFVTPDQPNGHTPIPQIRHVYTPPTDLITWNDSTYRGTYRVNNSILEHYIAQYPDIDLRDLNNTPYGVINSGNDTWKTESVIK